MGQLILRLALAVGQLILRLALEVGQLIKFALLETNTAESLLVTVCLNLAATPVRDDLY